MQQTIIFSRSIATALLLCVALSVTAQSNGSNSSYSRFGLGTMDNQSQGFNRSMGGVSQGMRNGRIVNMLNPASYSAIDSLSFIFDVGLNLGYGHLSDGKQSSNVRNTALSNVNAGFRIRKGLGMSFGFVPYSTIGYNFNTQTRVGSSFTSTQSITTRTNYTGDGGLHQMYIGAGWNPFAGLSFGANVSYMWGNYDHGISQTIYEGNTTNTSTNSLHSAWSCDIRTYKIDLGLQYPIRIGKQNELTLGATASIGHKIGSDMQMMRYTPKDTTTCTLKHAFDLPYTFGGGASYRHGVHLTVAADYVLERWNGCKVPVSHATATDVSIVASTEQYTNRHRANVGAEYVIGDETSRRFGQFIRYRVGASYSSSYVQINGQNGPSEYGVTAGVGLPLTHSGKSMLNVGAQWMHRSAPNMIKENYVMLNVGVTFNERWFEKWRIN